MVNSESVKEKGKTRVLFQNVIRKHIRRPERLTVSEWAEKYRILDESSNLAGKWSNDVTPYLKEIMDAACNPHIRHINLCKASQLGGTEALINIIGWTIMQRPAPAMMVYPDEDLAKDISNDKLKPAFQKTLELKKRFYENLSKEMKLRFQGMTIHLRGAGSPSKLSSKAIKYLFFDEIDKMGGASKKEASPYKLALERTKTFKYNKKVFTCSTPTLKSNYVWTIHEEAEEQRHYFVPCPHCKELIEFKFKQVRIPKIDMPDLSITEKAASARYVCQECSCIIENKHKPAMLRKGKWIAVKKTCKGNAASVSFWINSLYSFFVSWEDAAKEFLESKDDPERLQNFVNSWLAEPWEDTKLKTNADLVMERQTEYEAFEVPDYAKLLTAGVDVQETSLYWTIRAWGDYQTSQTIAHGQAVSFREIEQIMNLEYVKRNKEKLTVDLVLIDSGDQTDAVYEFCAGNSDWALPCKGTDSKDAHYRISKINKSDSRAYGMRLVLVDGGRYKDSIAARMRRENGVGSWMVYHGCDWNYAEQVTAEHKVNVKNGNGKTVLKWVVKKSHAENHYLDAEVYAYAAGDIMGIRRMHLNEIAEEEPEIKQEESESEEQWIKQNESWI